MKKYAIILVWMNIIAPIYATIPTEDINSNKIIDELYTKSILLKELKKYNQSKSLLMQIINKDPKQVDAYLLIAELEYLMNNWLQAIEQTKTYLQIIDFKDTKNYLDISWAYFLIGESRNSMDYIIQFIQDNKELLNTNIYILIDTILKKGFYHFIQDEDLMFNLIITTIFQIETYDDTIFTIFLNNLAIIKQIPFYEFNKIKIKDLELQIKTLKNIKNSINGITKIT
ncbi:tetratricopeptide repeat protein [Borrelia hermsii]|uniref:tetratricopeptide repeat protein n=1 Tax=Borrelia hermsii TaxID=140 RepID=UPI001CF1F1AE|nr:tetratricopeptide repeat protein [Borrelia hermsii]UCP01339.1 tetratricopeptide repeat protein [Borrelia hermsii]UEQ06966.1 tetratricopeptide repeat protein [Borrelia hermsii]